MTTPDQLSPGADDVADPAGAAAGRVIGRSRRDFWRPRRRLETGQFLRVFRHAMACRFEILLPATSAAALAAARAALQHADRLEQAWSVFRDDSDLSRLNRAAGGGACTVDDELAALLERCRGLNQATNGAFDITATPLSRCWRLLQTVYPGYKSRADANDELARSWVTQFAALAAALRVAVG